MKEASPVKFYFAKYFFLAFGLLQWLISGLILNRNGQIPRSQFAAFVFFTMGLVFVSLFLLVSSKIKRVAIGKNKIVIHGRQEQRIEWPEVKSIKTVPYFNMYRLKIKGHKEQIYFFPDQSTPPLYGLFPTTSLWKGKIKE
jgi:hypothetical protein